MECHGELRIDPGTIESEAGGAEIELVVAHTEWSTTAAVLRRASVLLAGMPARITLVAVQSVPFPAPLSSAAASHAHLVGQLADLATQSTLAVTPQVVLARGREAGFRYALKAESTILVGSPQKLWQTSEERLARALANDGHKVALLHV